MRLWTLSPMQRSPSLGTCKITNNMPLNIEIPHISKTRNYKEKMINGIFRWGEGGYFLSQKDEKKDTILRFGFEFPLRRTIRLIDQGKAQLFERIPYFVRQFPLLLMSEFISNFNCRVYHFFNILMRN